MIIATYFLIICFMILILFRVLHTDGFLKYLVVGHFVFVSLGLIIRPLILLITQPSPEYGDAFADSRLIQNGSYDQALFEIGIHTLFWIVIFGLFLDFSQKIALSRKKKQRISNLNLDLIPVVAFLFVTLFANFIEYKGLFDSRFLTWISVAALPCVGLAVHLSFEQKISNSQKFLLILIIGGISLTLSVITRSKSPIFFFIFIYLMNINSKKIDNDKIGLKPRKLVPAGLLFAVTVVIFTFIQKLKDGDELTSLNSRVGQKYFGEFTSIYTILKRFDLFRAVSDVWYVGEGSWYSFESYLRIMLSSLEWNFGSDAPNFGGQWAIHVLQHSPDSTFSPVVSLSQSALAEGWLLGGYLGIVFTSLLMSGIMVCVASMITGGLFSRLIAFYIISSNSIFEGGVVANLESISTGVRTAILIWMILALLSGSPQKFSRNQSVVT